MLKPNDIAPDFELQADDGSTVRLSDLRGRKVVLYFYPKDDTPGCTIEACEFRDRNQDLAASGAVVLGVSPDTVESHRKFREKYGLDFRLLADTDHRVAEAYGVWRRRRITAGRTGASSAPRSSSTRRAAARGGWRRSSRRGTRRRCSRRSGAPERSRMGRAGCGAAARARPCARPVRPYGTRRPSPPSCLSTSRRQPRARRPDAEQDGAGRRDPDIEARRQPGEVQPHARRRPCESPRPLLFWRRGRRHGAPRQPDVRVEERERCAGRDEPESALRAEARQEDALEPDLAEPQPVGQAPRACGQHDVQQPGKAEHDRAADEDPATAAQGAARGAPGSLCVEAMGSSLVHGAAAWVGRRRLGRGRASEASGPTCTAPPGRSRHEDRLDPPTAPVIPRQADARPPARSLPAATRVWTP